MTSYEEKGYMIESNKLRIGNLVETDSSEGNIKTVVEIKHKMASVKYIRTDTNEPHQSMVDYERLVPIELTKEWLLKFGFNTEYKKGYIGIDVKHENGMTTDFVLSFPYRMGEWQTYFAWEFNNYMFQKIEHVHDLQNFFFALTGQELVFSTEP